MTQPEQRFISLRGERAFARLRKGRRGHHKFLSVRWLPCKQHYAQAGRNSRLLGLGKLAHHPQSKPVSRVGFVVSKKVGNAVVRNKVRRRLREGLHALWLEHPPQRKPVDMIVIAKPDAAQANYWQLKAGLTYALYKSELLERRP